VRYSSPAAIKMVKEMTSADVVGKRKAAKRWAQHVSADRTVGVGWGTAGIGIRCESGHRVTACATVAGRRMMVTGRNVGLGEGTLAGRDRRTPLRMHRPERSAQRPMSVFRVSTG
jgi:hypothetical protein